MLRRLEELYLRINRLLVGLMMGAMFVFVFANVVTRYGFGFSIAWTEEVSSFLLIWVTFLGAGLALREGRHVAIDFFQDRMPEGARRMLRTALGLVILAFFGLLVFYGIQFVIFGWSKLTIVTLIPRGIPYLAVPIGAAMFALHLLFIFRRFVERDWEAMHSEEASDETAETA